jgi:allophanate hydrolase
MTRPLDLPSLAAAYAGGLDPAELARDIRTSIVARGERPVWISLVPEEDLLARAETIKAALAGGADLPLFGVPFAVKDNIDVAGLPTTAGCPEFAFVAERSATVVERLEAAGAILIGKTNLDQFATGLNGTRSPYGIPACVFDADYVSGGSSSGSGVAVASGLVSFALGTDTAGSGRVPASFNNIVGLKPTKGLISTRGVLPACRSQDAVSVFAGCVEDAVAVTAVAAGFDAEDIYSRRAPATALAGKDWARGFRFGIPAETPDFFGDAEAEALFHASIEHLKGLGGVAVSFDLAIFQEAALLLYAGPWVTERLVAIKDFAAAQPEHIHPVVRDIVLGGARYSAVDAFEAQYRLAELTRRAEAEWAGMDVMLLPTAGTIYTIADMLADPVRLNSNLGAYTNFVNLMDLSAIAIPAGFRPNGLPFGVTLIGHAFEDGAIASLAASLHRTLADPTIGGTGLPLPPARSFAGGAGVADGVEVAVVGAHLSGLPLNHQLTSRGGRLLRAARTAPGYSFYALPGTTPPKPGLVFDGTGEGRVEVEVWSLPASGFGSFVAEIPAPLGIGTLVLEDGSAVKGFVCEAHAVREAEDITAHGGWRAFLANS